MKSDLNKLKNFFCLFQTQWLPYVIATLVVGSRVFMITYIYAMISSKAIAIVEKGTGNMVKLFFYLILWVVCFAVVDTLGVYLQTNTIHKISVILRKKMFQHALDLSVSDIDQFGKRNELISRMNYDLDTAIGLLSYGLLAPVMYCVSGIGATAIVLKEHWKICAAVYVLGVIAFFLQLVLTGKTRKHLTEIQEEKSAALSVSMQTFSNAPGIKMSDMSDYTANLFRNKIRRYDKAYTKKGKLGGVYGIIQGVVRLACFFGVFCYGLLFADMDLETVVFVSQLTPLIGTMFLSLSDCIASIQRSMVGIERLLELFQFPVEKDSGEEFTVRVLGDVIETEALACGYPNGSVNISDIHAVLNTGNMIALKGASGCGKTSLLRLLLQLYPYTEGSLKFLKQEIRGCSSASVRQHVAYVPQENVIFPGTIRDNLLLGNPRGHVSDEEIATVLMKVGANAWVSRIGLDASLKENGMNLSGGQRQMLAIARALLYRKPILILDEAFSSMDEEHISQIMRVLSGMKDINYAIIVTHDIRVLQKCSTVVDLQR